jgi:hypothetical protein
MGVFSWTLLDDDEGRECSTNRSGIRNALRTLDRAGVAGANVVPEQLNR